MTPDQIAEQIRNGLQAAERALEARGHNRALRRVKLAHAILEDVADDYVKSGNISALSVGDKPEGP